MFMSFGENLQYLRKRDGITQETLAERLSVSRQTVSKWESDGAFPEMDKLIVLCDMFNVTMDDMVRGTVEYAGVDIADDDIAEDHNTVDESAGIGKDEYLHHCRIFAGKIAGGVASVLAGVAALLLFDALIVPQYIPIMIFFLFLMVGVALCVSGGISHDSFIKMNPSFGFEFSPEEISVADRRFSHGIIMGIVLILIDVTILVSVFLAFPEAGVNDNLEMEIVSLFMIILAVAVALLIWSGIIKDSYDTVKKDKVRSGKEKLADKITGAIMLAATAVFLLLGFVWNMWHPGWAVFPIGGVICGIVSTLMGSED